MLADAHWFHTTGITPALGPTSVDATRVAMLAARSLETTVSLDLNFRKKLWSWGEGAAEVMPLQVEGSNVDARLTPK